jgi:hypothetical protein
VTYFPDSALGDARFDYFKKVVNIEPLDKLLVPYTSDMGDVGIALFTFLYVDFLDTSVSIGLYTRNEAAVVEKVIVLALRCRSHLPILFYHTGNAHGTGISHGIHRRRRQLPQQSRRVLS